MQEFLFKSKPQSLPLAKLHYAEDNLWGLRYFLISALEEVLVTAHYDMLISNLVVLAVTSGDNEYSMLEKQNLKLIYLLNSYVGSSEVYMLVKKKKNIQKTAFNPKSRQQTESLTLRQSVASSLFYPSVDSSFDVPVELLVPFLSLLSHL